MGMILKIVPKPSTGGRHLAKDGGKISENGQGPLFQELDRRYYTISLQTGSLSGRHAYSALNYWFCHGCCLNIIE